MGDTELTSSEVQQLVQQLGQDYKGNKYHLLQRNCNHFASELCYQLTGRHTPIWVRLLACSLLVATPPLAHTQPHTHTHTHTQRYRLR